ncbi:hypothetical protein V1387_16620 [Allomuricauda taeanensis]|uniref:hypothetical protein n=1 Tax=Flagellimonas taeanensis TaxID=1005926 RepID=UPI002E7AFAC3|nr:hypothetical protein [Allomuricauda taeanensis]MEE1964317.1 hypothetical protein [Allomuricauda taeanensis]
MLNKIILIDSIPEEDKQTGNELFSDTISKYKLFYKTDVELHYKKVSNQVDFFKELEWILNYVDIDDEVIIHFEAHGNDDEICLANNSRVNWKILSNYLIPINEKTKNKLHINVVTCFGMHIGRIMDMQKTAPYKSFIAAKGEIFPSEIIADNTLFYQNLLENKDVYQSIINTQKIQTQSKFKIKDVETVLELALHKTLIPLLLSSSGLMAKQIFEDLLKIEIDLATIQKNENASDYIFDKFIKRFTYQ